MDELESRQLQLISSGENLSLPPFTIKEIDAHRHKSGKLTADDKSTLIKKTFRRGVKFVEKYLLPSTMNTRVNTNLCMAKSSCGASMSLREIHHIQ